MKKIILALALSFSLSACASNPLGALLGGGSSTEQSSSSKGGGLGDIIGGVVGGLLSTDKVDVNKMVGTWTYTSPAVCFKSDNFLQKAGGAAAAGTIENKLAPYYKTAGLNKMVLTINEDHTFTMKSGKVTAGGTVETDGQGEVYFNFKALGSIPAGKMKAYVTLTAGRQMSLMFDVTKLVTVVNMVGNVSGSTAIKSVSSILSSYDGICAGFKLNKK
ncbi:MAG: DUF4923 family protein [Muribaculaceae bacterium]|nr:DUF4923 family protein [Muribaculaceae bacterium]